MASQSQLTSQGLPHEDRRPKDLLVGSAGQEFISKLLKEASNVEESVKTIQARGALTDRRTRPLLSLLDQLNLTRAESLLGVLEAAKRQLFAILPHLPPDALLELLDESFPYIALRDLKDIPLAVLDRINPVPATFLRQIAADADLFQELPIGVQRQVWDMDRKLLQAHGMPQVAAYTSDPATLLRAMDMDQFLALEPGKRVPSQGAHPSEAALLTHKVHRRQLRSMNPALRRLVDMVGRSQRIYKGLALLCASRLKDAQGLVMGMQEGALCTLRSQLLMALHDANSAHTSEPNFSFEQEPCHRLAWTLDACINDKTLDDKRLNSLMAFFAPVDRAGGRPSLSAPPKKRSRVSMAGDDAESQGVPSSEGSRMLGDAAMILRDPSALYFLVHQVLRRLRVVMKAEGSPSNDTTLVFLTRLIQLACSVRSLLREHRFQFPHASTDMLTVVYPCLMGCLFDADDRVDPSVVQPEGKVEQIAELVGLLTKDEVTRKLTQSLALERLALLDLATSQVLLTALQQALAKTSDKAIAEWTPFAVTLAQRMLRLVREGPVSVSHALWRLIFDSLLMRLVDTDVKVQEEMLYVLQAAALHPSLSTAQLAVYLQTMLRHSKRSRRRAMARQQEKAKSTQDYGGYKSEGGYASETYFGYSTGGAASEGGWARPPPKGSDGLKHLYRDFPKKHGQLTPATAPELFEYLGSASEPERE